MPNGDPDLQRLRRRLRTIGERQKTMQRRFGALQPSSMRSEALARLRESKRRLDKFRRMLGIPTRGEVARVARRTGGGFAELGKDIGEGLKDVGSALQGLKKKLF